MPDQTQPNTMSLFRRVHIRTVPSEFLDPGSQPIQLRFCQLNAKKMAKADLADTLAAIEQLNQIMASMSDKDRAGALDRQKHAALKAQDTAAPNTFADYDNTTLIALAHVERRADDGSEWIELTTTEIDDLLCAEWRAGEIYDVSKPNPTRRGKNTHRVRRASAQRRARRPAPMGAQRRARGVSHKTPGVGETGLGLSTETLPICVAGIQGGQHT